MINNTERNEGIKRIAADLDKQVGADIISIKYIDFHVGTHYYEVVIESHLLNKINKFIYMWNPDKGRFGSLFLENLEKW